MKKAVFILLIIMLVSYITAIILVGIQIQNLDGLRSAIMVVPVSQTREIEISEEINSITLDSSIVDTINIYSTTEEKIKVEVYGECISIVSKDINVYVTDKKESLKIVIKETGLQRYLKFIIYTIDLTLDVYIPETYNKEIKIDADYDDIYIEDILLENLTIKGINEYDE